MNQTNKTQQEFDQKIINRVENWIEELEDTSNLQELLLRFRRVNIFNTRTVLDYQKDMELLSQGRLPKLNAYFFIDNDDRRVFAVHTKREVLRKVQRRKHSTSYKEIILRETSAPVTVTPHALERYRQRSGTFMTSDMLWDEVVLQPHQQQLTSETITVRSDLMQPTFGGAWLGQRFAAADSTLDYHYKHKHQRLSQRTYPPQPRFKALTWVHVNDMLPFQRAAWDAYRRNDADSAVAIMSNNINNNQLDIYNIGNVHVVNENSNDLSTPVRY
jgi:hypothetical protein